MSKIKCCNKNPFSKPVFSRSCRLFHSLFVICEKLFNPGRLVSCSSFSLELLTPFSFDDSKKNCSKTFQFGILDKVFNFEIVCLSSFAKCKKKTSKNSCQKRNKKTNDNNCCQSFLATKTLFLRQVAFV